MSLIRLFTPIFCLVFSTSVIAETIHVPDDQPTIQLAILTAQPGDTVLVAPGTYNGGIRFYGKAITVKSEQGPYVTRLDGMKNSHVVRFRDGEGLDSILQGFEIYNGRSTQGGGGIYCLNQSSPQILDNLIRKNTAYSTENWPRGGGIYCTDGSSPLIDGNIISENLCTAGADGWARGGGIACEDSAPTITNNLIEYNVAEGRNYRVGFGGGLQVDNYNSPEVPILISGNIFRGNRSDGDGGGIYLKNANYQINNCVFHENRALDTGGALYCDGHGASLLLNNTILENRADLSGALFMEGDLSLSNGIFWNNQAETGPEICVGLYSTLIIDHSDVKGGQASILVASSGTLDWGAGMIDADPLLNDAGQGDYHLTGPSPCIDSGNNLAAGLPSLDFEENTRIFDGDGDGNAVVDMGVDEILAFQVPGTYPSIQSAIDAAVDRGVVCVAPGTYLENIDFSGKAIQVTANQGPASTWIDGRGLGPVVTFQSGEKIDSLLEGFSLFNGGAENGGGIYCSGASPEIRENIVQDNAATQSGGGIYCESASPQIHGNTLLANEATSGGGLASVLGATPELLNNTFVGNTASGSGGGLYCLASSPEVVNCLICWNGAPTGGGIFAGPGASPRITHDTVYGNSALTAGGGLECGSEALTVANSIFWNNTAPTGPQISGALALVTYCDVKGGWPGTGNIAAQPLFLNVAGQDFRLSVDSPCLDVGDPDLPGLPEADFEGHDRIRYQGPDLGMDEYWLGNRILHVPSQYSTLQKAINQACDTDTVLVAPGTYNGCLSIEWKAVSLISENGSESTVLDGEQDGSVVTFRDCGESACGLEGFTLTNGSGNYSGGLYSGGGLDCQRASPTIQHNRFINNATSEHGGGLYFYDSRAQVLDNEIMENSCEDDGGGLCSHHSYTFEGGIRLQDNLFSGNSAGRIGGAIYIIEGEVVKNIITGNQADYAAGLLGAETDILNNRISYNIASNDGGGLQARGGTVSNNLIFGNQATWQGGGMVCDGEDATYTSNTIVGNSAGSRGGGVVCYDTSVEFLNTIVWGNQAPDGPSFFCFLRSGSYYMALKLDYSVVEHNEAGIYMGQDTQLFYCRNMLEENPLMVNAANDNFHLRPDSPCIDRGINGAANLTSLDMDGQPRIAVRSWDLGKGQPAFEPRIDIGADESLGRKHLLDEELFYK